MKHRSKPGLGPDLACDPIGPARQDLPLLRRQAIGGCHTACDCRAVRFVGGRIRQHDHGMLAGRCHQKVRDADGGVDTRCMLGLDRQFNRHGRRPSAPAAGDPVPSEARPARSACNPSGQAESDVAVAAISSSIFGYGGMLPAQSNSSAPHEHGAFATRRSTDVTVPLPPPPPICVNE